MNDQPRYLGLQSAMPTDPDAFILDCVLNPEQNRPYAARFTIPEFTSLCPITGQPDFAIMVIDYIPKLKLVESKALKLYMTSFRNVGEYHEACVNRIADKFWQACAPHYMRIVAYWYPRGGIPIDVMVESGSRNIAGEHVAVLPIETRMYAYRGR